MGTESSEHTQPAPRAWQPGGLGQEKKEAQLTFVLPLVLLWTSLTCTGFPLAFQDCI